MRFSSSTIILSPLFYYILIVYSHVHFSQLHSLSRGFISSGFSSLNLPPYLCRFLGVDPIRGFSPSMSFPGRRPSYRQLRVDPSAASLSLTPLSSATRGLTPRGSSSIAWNLAPPYGRLLLNHCSVAYPFRQLLLHLDYCS